jgi:WD40 repeat protein
MLSIDSNCYKISNSVAIHEINIVDDSIFDYSQYDYLLYQSSNYLTTIQWYLNNNPIPEATNRTIVHLVNGTYYVITTYKNCTFFSNSITIGGADSIVRIYPNPAFDNIFISADTTGLVYIYDVTGKKLFVSTMNEHNVSIDCLSFSRGLYFLEFIGDDKKKKIVKFVKQ